MRWRVGGTTRRRRMRRKVRRLRPHSGSPGVTLGYGGNAQVELSTRGRPPRVHRRLGHDGALGVAHSPATSCSPRTRTTTTSTRISPRASRARQLFVREGEIESGDVRILGRRRRPLAGRSASSRREAATTSSSSTSAACASPTSATSARLELTAEQLDALGDVDVAVTQLENSFSQMDAEEQEGLRDRRAGRSAPGDPDPFRAWPRCSTPDEPVAGAVCGATRGHAHLPDGSPRRRAFCCLVRTPPTTRRRCPSRRSIGECRSAEVARCRRQREAVES